jgi:hypothetical protein
MIGRGNRSTRRKPTPNAALSTTNPTCCSGANLDRHGGKPETNRLSYGTAFSIYLAPYKLSFISRPNLRIAIQIQSLLMFLNFITPKSEAKSRSIGVKQLLVSDYFV